MVDMQVLAGKTVEAKQLSGLEGTPLVVEALRQSRLYGSVVIVTGAARGIGRAIAKELGAAGATVVVDYAHSKAAAEALVTELKHGGAGDAMAVEADVADAAQAAALI